MESLTEKTTFREWWNEEHKPLPEITEEEFDKWGMEVGNAYAFASWKAVDWAVEAKDRGYEYARMAAILGRPVGSCRTLVKIGNAYPPVTRRYALGPSFYDTAKVLPVGDRDEVLSKAVENELTRDAFRAFVGEYRKLKAKPDDGIQPAWNSGNGGEFGDAADKAEKAALPKRETKREDPATSESPFDDGMERSIQNLHDGQVYGMDSISVPNPIHEWDDVNGLTKCTRCGYVRCVDEEGDFVDKVLPACKSSEDLSDLIPKGQVVSEEPQEQAKWHYIDGDVEELLRRREEHIKQVEAENTSLKAKLAGNLVELDDDHAALIDKIVKYRRSKFPKAEIDRQTETQMAIRRRWSEIQRSR